MTIEKLLGFSEQPQFLEELEAMSEKDLTAMLSPYFKVTRPQNPGDFASRKQEAKEHRSQIANRRVSRFDIQKSIDSKLDKLKQLGIDI